MTLDEILQDIHGLDQRLRALEQEYGLLSENQYSLYRGGENAQRRDLTRSLASGLPRSPSTPVGLLLQKSRAN